MDLVTIMHFKYLFVTTRLETTLKNIIPFYKFVEHTKFLGHETTNSNATLKLHWANLLLEISAFSKKICKILPLLCIKNTHIVFKLTADSNICLYITVNYTILMLQWYNMCISLHYWWLSHWLLVFPLAVNVVKQIRVIGIFRNNIIIN